MISSVWLDHHQEIILNSTSTTPIPKFNVPENIVFVYVGQKNLKDS